jgi:hypothetical protein
MALRGFLAVVVLFAAAGIFLAPLAVVLPAAEPGFFAVIFVPAVNFFAREAGFGFAAAARRGFGAFTFGFAAFAVDFEVVFGFAPALHLADFAKPVLAEDGLRAVIFFVSLSSSFFLEPVTLARDPVAGAVFFRARAAPPGAVLRPVFA